MLIELEPHERRLLNHLSGQATRSYNFLNHKPIQIKGGKVELFSLDPDGIRDDIEEAKKVFETCNKLIRSALNADFKQNLTYKGKFFE